MMEKTNFWKDAAVYGAILGCVQILLTLLGLFWNSSLLTLISLVVIITMLFYFTKRRTLLYGGGENGYSYGQCMKYIFWMAVFAGVLVSIWELAARNVLFTSKYEVLIENNLGRVATLYTADQYDMLLAMAKSMLFSPVSIVVTSMLGTILQECFFGLFISAFVKRTPDIFSEHKNEQA